MKSIFLDVLPEAFSIVRFPSSHIVPKWVEQSRIYSLTRSENELSIVCETKVLPNDISFRNDGWRALRVRGTLDFSLTGILSAIALPLAKEKISIFALSTFDTDYVLVQADNLKKAALVLFDAGISVK